MRSSETPTDERRGACATSCSSQACPPPPAWPFRTAGTRRRGLWSCETISPVCLEAYSACRRASTCRRKETIPSSVVGVGARRSGVRYRRDLSRVLGDPCGAGTTRAER